MANGGLIQTIAHPTDFSEAGAEAFAHALRLAVATKSRLLLLHVRETGREDEHGTFPHVREVLARWGLMQKNEAPSQIKTRLGVKVAKVDIHHKSAADGLFEFVLSHRADLIVIATHGREGLSRYVSGSVSEDLSRRTHVPTLFIAPNAKGFVDSATGAMQLKRILFPVAEDPSPLFALNLLGQMLAPLGVSSQAFRFLHIGAAPPRLPLGADRQVEIRNGPVVETILDVAEERTVDMIAMPTAGHKSFVDALKGSTAEQVLRHAPCPVLTIRTAAGTSV